MSRNVLDAFVHARLIYESREPSKGGNDYHNAVFVGLDEHGVPRHAHKRGLYSAGPGLKRNVTGCPLASMPASSWSRQRRTFWIPGFCSSIQSMACSLVPHRAA